MWMHTDALHSVQRQMFDLLEGWLRHKSDMVNFEAARAICEMKNVTAAQLTRSISGTSSLRARYSLADRDLSPPIVPFLPQAGLEIRCYPYSRRLGTYASSERCDLQC